jgi:hypothetical protein
VWNVNTGVARFFSQSARIHLLVQELFEKTFRLKLVPESPGTAAFREKLGQQREARFDALAPAHLARAGGSR